MADILGSGLLHMAFMGDDNLMYVPASWDLRDLELHLFRLGLQPKITREEIFLNMMPVPVLNPVGEETTAFSLLPGRILARLFHTTAVIPSVEAVPVHLRGVCDCLYPSVVPDPVLQPLFARLSALVPQAGKPSKRGLRLHRVEPQLGCI